MFITLALVLMLIGGCCTLCIGRWMVIIFTGLCGAAFMLRSLLDILNIYWPDKYSSTGWYVRHPSTRSNECSTTFAHSLSHMPSSIGRLDLRSRCWQ